MELLAAEGKFSEARAMCDAALATPDGSGPSHGSLWCYTLGRVLYDEVRESHTIQDPLSSMHTSHYKRKHGLTRHRCCSSTGRARARGGTTARGHGKVRATSNTYLYPVSRTVSLVAPTCLQTPLFTTPLQACPALFPVSHPFPPMCLSPILSPPLLSASFASQARHTSSRQAALEASTAAGS